MKVGDTVKTYEGIGKIIGFRCAEMFVEVEFEKNNTAIIFNKNEVQLL